MPIMISELCDGGDVDTFVRRHEFARMRIPERDIWTFAHSITGALAFLHYGIGCKVVPKAWKPIMHRDLKPENVLIKYERHGQPIFLLADFDLADFADEVTMNRRCAAGTPAWQPPEQWLDHSTPRATPAGDIWALGAIIQYMATGRCPAEDRCPAQGHRDVRCAGPAHCGCNEHDLCDGRDPEQAQELEDFMWDERGWANAIRDRVQYRSVALINELSMGKDGYTGYLEYFMLQCLVKNTGDRLTANVLHYWINHLPDSLVKFLSSDKYPRPREKPRRSDVDDKQRIDVAENAPVAESELVMLHPFSPAAPLDLSWKKEAGMENRLETLMKDQKLRDHQGNFEAYRSNFPAGWQFGLEGGVVRLPLPAHQCGKSI